MSHAKTKSNPENPISVKPFSYRPATHLAPRFKDILVVTKRTKASVLHEGLEKVLPDLETKHAPELARLKRSKSTRQVAAA